MSDSIEAMAQRLQATREDLAAYPLRLDEAELARPFEFPVMPKLRPAGKDARMQVMMDSEHHRAMRRAPPRPGRKASHY
jgi:hypothetical protein